MGSTRAPGVLIFSGFHGRPVSREEVISTRCSQFDMYARGTVRASRNLTPVIFMPIARPRIIF